MQPLEERIQKIEERNRSVENDKAWETSWTRMLSICVATYFVVAIFLSFIGVTNPFIAAIVPVIGFALSTLSLPFVKQWWITRR